MNVSQRVLVLEQLSAFLDGQLNETEQQQIEKRLAQETKLKEIYAGLRKTKLLLSRLPRLQAPRSFTLTPEMVTVRAPRRKRPFYTSLRWATSIAATLLVVLFGVEYILGGSLYARSVVTSEQAADGIAQQDENTFALEAPEYKGADPEPLIIWGAPGVGGGGAAKNLEENAATIPEETEEELPSAEALSDGLTDFDLKIERHILKIQDEPSGENTIRRLLE